MPEFSTLIDQAEELLRPVVRTTPVEPSPELSRILGVPVWLKLECLQVTGSFKIRGAHFALARIAADSPGGVATCSAGNHGLGLAYSGRELGVPVTIYVPRQVDSAKALHLAGLGAELVVSPFNGFDDTEVWAIGEAQAAGLPFISAYDDPAILAGNGGTLMREIRRQVPDVETVISPVGGGGLLGGMAWSDARAGRLIAAQLHSSPALALSLERGEAVTRMPGVRTLAGGLEGGIGQTGFEALRESVSQTVLVHEFDLREGVRWMLRHHQYIIEPTSAVAVAACLDRGIRVTGPTVVVITGRNVAETTLHRIFDERIERVAKPPIVH
jgi:threonine dehydratase